MQSFIFIPPYPLFPELDAGRESLVGESYLSQVDAVIFVICAFGSLASRARSIVAALGLGDFT
jgi:hypothetical protein